MSSSTYISQIGKMNDAATCNIRAYKHTDYLGNRTLGDCPVACIKNLYIAYGKTCKLTYKDFYDFGYNKSKSSGMSIVEMFMLLDELNVDYKFTSNTDSMSHLIKSHLLCGYPVILHEQNHVYLATELKRDETGILMIKTINSNIDNLITWETFTGVMDKVRHAILINNSPDEVQYKQTAWSNINDEYSLRNRMLGYDGINEETALSCTDWEKTKRSKHEIK